MCDWRPRPESNRGARICSLNVTFDLPQLLYRMSPICCQHGGHSSRVAAGRPMARARSIAADHRTQRSVISGKADHVDHLNAPPPSRFHHHVCGIEKGPGRATGPEFAITQETFTTERQFPLYTASQAIARRTRRETGHGTQKGAGRSRRSDAEVSERETRPRSR